MYEGRAIYTTKSLWTSPFTMTSIPSCLNRPLGKEYVSRTFDREGRDLTSRSILPTRFVRLFQLKKNGKRAPSLTKIREEYRALKIQENRTVSTQRPVAAPKIDTGYRNRNGRAQAEEKDFDFALLAEAQRYAEKLNCARSVTFVDEPSMMVRQKPLPRKKRGKGRRRRLGKKKPQLSDGMRKRRPQRRKRGNNAPERGRTLNASKIEELVDNFRTGRNLKVLREALQDAERSKSESEKVITRIMRG